MVNSKVEKLGTNSKEKPSLKWYRYRYLKERKIQLPEILEWKANA